MIKRPIFVFWGIFFPDLTSINDSLTIELNYLLNWISRFFLNRIIFWNKSWVRQYWIQYWINPNLAKFKHWIESDWVLPTTRPRIRKKDLCILEIFTLGVRAFQIRKVCNFLEISILLLHISTSTQGSSLDFDSGGKDQTKDYQWVNC